jgi:hypothetical protein
MKKGQTFMGNQIYFKIAGKKKNERSQPEKSLHIFL